MDLLREFKNIEKGDVSLAGGKGASLGEMTQVGISVPPGFVILSSAFEKFLEETDLNVEIDAILHITNHKEIHTIEKASKEITAFILSKELPQDIAKEIQKFFKNLGAKFVAVRSSATAEDSANAAWAGQLESYLNTTEENLLENVKKCWASLFTPRAIFYRSEKGLHKQKISVAVVVQKMVESEKSGIAFSVHPVTQDRNQLIIEAGFGLGEAIVSGQITPDSYVVEKQPRRIIDKNVEMQLRGLYCAKSGGNEWRDVPKWQGEKQTLSDEEILELSEIILKIEKHYGFPCDIEWAFENGKFYIVQSRPITTLATKPLEQKDDKHKWTKILTRHNSVFMDSMKLYASANLFNDFGYDYRIRNYKIVNGENYVAEDYIFLVESLKQYLANHPNFLFEIIQRAHSDIGDYRKIWKKIEEAKVKSLSDDDLSKLFGKYLQTLYGLMAYLFLPLSAEKILTEKIQNILKLRVSETEIQNIFTKLTIPSRRSFVSEEQVEFLTYLQKLVGRGVKTFDKDSFTSHLLKWAWLGDHFFWGTFWRKDDLEPRFKEFIGKNLNTELVKIAEMEEGQRFEAEKLFKELRLSKEEVEIVRLAQEYVHFRTYRLDTLFYSEFTTKNMFAELSIRLGLSYVDLVLLTPKEIIESLNTRTNMKDVIEKRRTNYAIIVDDYIVSVYSGDEVEKFKERIIVASGSIKGSVAYAGAKVYGKARIILAKNDFSKLCEGDILITNMTTPDFVPLMKKCAAIVTDEGGITCHAAIISRELGKPCIIGTKVATQILKDGEMIEVDTATGIVGISK